MKKFKKISMMGFVGLMFVVGFLITTKYVDAVSIIDSGSSEPANPVTGQEYYRTDLRAHEIYDGQWVRQDDRVVSVLDFGAKGNDTGDDSAAFQAAIDSGEGMIFVPSGTYRIATKLNILNKSGLTLQGGGQFNTNIYWNGVSGGTLFEIEGSQGVTLRELWLNGNNVAATSLVISHNAGNTYNTILGLLDHVRLGNVTGTALKIGSSNDLQVDSWMFRDLFIDNYGVAVRLEGTMTMNMNFIGGGISGYSGIPSTVGFELVSGGVLSISNMEFIGDGHTIGYIRRSNVYGTVSLTDIQMESYGPFFIGSDDTAYQNKWPVVLNRVLIGFTGAAGTNIIDYKQVGPFIMNGCNVNSTNAANINFASPGAGGGVVQENGTRLLNVTVVIGGQSHRFGTSSAGVTRADGRVLIGGTENMTGRMVVRQGTADDTDNTSLVTDNGGATTAATLFTDYTTTGVSTTNKKIAQVFTRAAFVIVAGGNGTAFFEDLVCTGYDSVTPKVVSSFNTTGTPAVRTYTHGGTGVLRLRVASGTYSVHTFLLDVGQR